ncbi:helix-turn-helix domain-containing protein [Aliirhizobium smilacinae]|uniref:Helix-turn-helix transcriptional regulator n=1 Tax=Aliirhizobium smilacinae TaxID=1395944 RepID=A0A5C4XLT6_9HYPH|nr:AraC family transcriptional regulator [Rhizobium smilacinae]TNM63811.1 helix-turn-helix transcriptional regulator [Rhizobium smilacinae]
MSFWHSMDWRTEGIQVVSPVKWRQLDGLVSVYWQAESQSGAQGYYLAEDPRIMIFFNDVSSRVRISNKDGSFTHNYRPMTRAIYVPAGVPMWTSSRSTHRFSHLNLHMHKHRLMRYLAPSIGSSAALTALRRPVEIQDIGPIETLAGLLVDEISNPSRHAIYAESLVGSIVTGLLDIPNDEAVNASGRLTHAQMNTLTTHIDARSDHRLTIAEMAAIVGLSESWFASVFKNTTGKTPLQWQLSRRIDIAQNLLLESDLAVADIAAQLGFTDQAHLTKAFRQVVGDTPAAWRRMRQIS